MYVANISTKVTFGKRSRLISISLTHEDMEHVPTPHDDALFITTEINDFNVKRILVDSGSSTYVLFLDVLLVMGKTNKDLKRVHLLWIRFTRRITYPLKAINFLVVLGEVWKTLRTEVTFIVVDAPNSYNTIVRRTTLNLQQNCHFNVPPEDEILNCPRDWRSYG